MTAENNGNSNSNCKNNGNSNSNCKNNGNSNSKYGGPSAAPQDDGEKLATATIGQRQQRW